MLPAQKSGTGSETQKSYKKSAVKEHFAPSARWVAKLGGALVLLAASPAILLNNSLVEGLCHTR